jgi:hypothetical protein
MTRLGSEDFTCTICGTVSAQTVIYSTFLIAGGRDLDFRVEDGQRQRMESRLQECPECGYTAHDISEDTNKNIVRKVMESDAWKDLMPKAPLSVVIPPGGLENRPGFWRAKLIEARSEGRLPAMRFLRRALIDVAFGETAAAAESALRAAWIDDDLAVGAQTKPSQKHAASSRQWAAELFRRVLAEGELDAERANTIRLILIDVLRRASQWDEALTLCREAGARNVNQEFAAIVRLQEWLIGVRDDSCHTVSEAVGGGANPNRYAGS